MKKFYAIMAAVLFSASIFAAPSKADLAKYQKEGYYVACFGTPADATCNDIVWVGTYNGWKLDDPDIIVCEKVTGFDGYYVAVVPVGAYKDNDTSKDFDPAGECSGKPVQYNECGKLEWAYQNGGTGACTLVSGTVTIDEKGEESDLKDWSKTEPTVIDIAFWKNHANPCAAQCSAVNLTVRIYDPFCAENPEFEPTLKGSFNNWGDAAKMTFKGSYYEYVIEDATASLEFKFNNDVNGSWDNQFEYFTPEDEENDVPAKWQQFGSNFKPLAEEDPLASYYKKEENVITFDFADNDKYRYAMCGVDTNTYAVKIIAKFPELGMPEAGVEVMGNFGGDATWQNGVVMTFVQITDPIPAEYYEADLYAKAGNEFKFREAGDEEWNQVVTISDGKDLQFKFGDYWADDTWKGVKIKLIDLNLSDPTKYCWKSEYVEGIENVVLTENAQKVVVDGVLYIVRDNKMFTIQGAQVR